MTTVQSGAKVSRCQGDKGAVPARRETPSPRRLPPIPGILARVCDDHGVDPSELLGNSRNAEVVRCRRACIRELRALRGMSTPEIAQALNLRSHSSVVEVLKAAPPPGPT